MSTTEKPLKIHCNKCGRTTTHKVLFETSRDFRDPPRGPYYVEWGYTYQTVECGGCEEVSYYTRGWCSEDYNPESGEPDYTHSYYPPPQKRPQPDFEFGVPFSIVFVLKELYTAINNNSRYLASTGIRTVLDMMIVDKIGDEGTFKDKVDKLVADGHINADEGKIMTAVIDAGNASAHRGFMPDDDVLSSMMDILERLIDKFYMVDARHRDSAAKADRIIKKVPPRKPKANK